MDSFPLIKAVPQKVIICRRRDQPTPMEPIPHTNLTSPKKKKKKKEKNQCFSGSLCKGQIVTRVKRHKGQTKFTVQCSYHAKITLDARCGGQRTRDVIIWGLPHNDRYLCTGMQGTHSRTAIIWTVGWVKTSATEGVVHKSL